jgi:3-deoxy-D-manno-octulosonic-acid transferase
VTIGVDPARVRMTGNVKFDLAPRSPGPVAKLLRGMSAGRFVVVGGSTHEGEEAALLKALAELSPRPFLVLAPRRPERFDAVIAMCERTGLSTARRSAPKATPDVVVLDSVGELADGYAAADAAFVGGSLVPHGGQNPIEAWSFSVPVLVGPHTANFREIISAGIAADAARVVAGASDLAGELKLLMSDSDGRRRRGAAGAALLAANRGAAGRTADLLIELLGHSA